MKKLKLSETFLAQGHTAMCLLLVTPFCTLVKLVSSEFFVGTPVYKVMMVVITTRLKSESELLKDFHRFWL